MSMNLESNSFNFEQTPTNISYLCMTDDNGNIQMEVKEKKCIAVFKRYILYKKEETENVCYKFYREKRNEDAKDYRKTSDNHIKQIEDLLKKNPTCKGVEIWIT